MGTVLIISTGPTPETIALASNVSISVVPKSIGFPFKSLGICSLTPTTPSLTLGPPDSPGMTRACESIRSPLAEP